MAMYWTFGVLNWGLRDLKWGLGGMVWFRFTPQVSSSPSLPPVVVVVAPMLCRQALAECVATSEKTAQETETGDRASSSRRRNNQFRFQVWKRNKKFLQLMTIDHYAVVVLFCEENNGLLLLLLFLSNSHFLFFCSVLEVLCWWLLGGGLFVCFFFPFPPWFHFLLVLCRSLLLCHDQRDFVY